MAATFTPLEATDTHFVMGETLRPLLTNAMGSAIEIFDTRGPAGAGPPPHTHPWEENYVVLSGELEVTVDGQAQRVGEGALLHVPANAVHGYRNVTDCHFLTIVTRGQAAPFFAQVASEVEMRPPDIAGIVRVAGEYGIEMIS